MSNSSKIPVAKGLGELANLMRSTQSAAQLNNPNRELMVAITRETTRDTLVRLRKTIGKDDPLELIIFKLLREFKGLTVKEAVQFISNPDIDTDAIEINTAMQALRNMGALVVAPGPGNIGAVFSVKKGVTLENITNKFNPTPVKQSTAFEHNPNGIIDPAEGLDRCIWKFMQDRRGYNIDVIAKGLNEFGFGTTIIKDRVIHLLKHKWFDRKGSGHAFVYYLKKHISIPPLAKKEPEVKLVAPIPASAPAAVVVAPRPKIQIKAKAKVFADTPRSTPINTIPHEAIMAKKETAVPVHHTPKAEEGVKTCIWKVMSDHKPYQGNDVALLLEEIGIKKTTVMSNMSELNAKGWFTRKENGINPPLYVLKSDIAMPIGEGPYIPRNRKVKTVKPSTKAAPKPKVEPKATQPQLDLATDESIGTLSTSESVLAKQTAAEDAVKKSIAGSGASRDDDNQEDPAEIMARLINKPMNQMTEQEREQFIKYGQSTSAAKFIKTNLPSAYDTEGRQQPNRSMGESEMRIPGGIAYVTPVKELITIAIKLNGVEISNDEAEAIAAHLIEAGFGNGASPKDDSTDGVITFDIGATIKGMHFKTDELNQIADSLIAKGFGHATLKRFGKAGTF